jgi:hypothetical protein
MKNEGQIQERSATTKSKNINKNVNKELAIYLDTLYCV